MPSDELDFTSKDIEDYPSVEEVKGWDETRQVQFCIINGFADIADYEDWLMMDPIEEDEVGKKNKNKNSYSLFSSTNQGAKPKGSGGVTATGGWSGTSYGTTYKTKSCPSHKGLDIFMDWKKANGQTVELAGAQGGSVIIDEQLKLVVDLAGMYKGPGEDTVKFYPAKGVNNGQRPGWINKMSRLTESVHCPDYLRIKWDDMGVPPFGFNFWITLYDLLPVGRTVVCCVGGHGRTGTALASLHMAHVYRTAEHDDSRFAWNFKDYIDDVRKHHCENAVESNSQDRYLKNLLEQMRTKTVEDGLSSTPPIWEKPVVEEVTKH